MASVYLWRGRWRAQIRRVRQRSISRTFDTKTEAERWAREIEHQADRGQRIGGTRATVGALLAEYRAARSDAGRPIGRQSNERYMLDRLGAWFATTRLQALSPAELRDYARARRRQGAGPYTVNMEVSKLGTALRYACALLEIPYHDPIAAARPTLHHLGLIGGQRKRRRRPSADEWAKLLAYLPTMPTAIPMRDIVQLAALVGLRRGEVCRLRWADLDQERRIVVVRDRKHPRQKAGNDEEVPLIGAALDIIMRQPRKSDLIFPYQPGTVSRCFTAACRALGIQDLHLHDLRHEATSSLLEAGWSIAEVQAVTGHKSLTNLQTYVNLDPAEVARKQR